MHKYDKIFHQADEGEKGFLNQMDVKVAILMMFGFKISKIEALQLLSSFGSQQVSGVKGLNLEQFKKAVSEKFVRDQDEEIRSAFLLFDRHCRGFITLDDMKQIFYQICPHFAEHRLELAFKELDRDGDGRISYRDFDFMMKFDYLS